MITRRNLVKTAGAGALLSASSLARLHHIADVAAQNGPVAIEYWHRNGGSVTEAWIDLANEFNALFGDRVTVTPVYQTDIQTLNQKIRAAAVGGGLPGATAGDDYDITQYVFNDILVPLDDYINDPEVGFTNEELADFLPFQLNRHKLDIYGGATYAFPQSFSAFTAWFNGDLLAAAGFDAPPKTWDEFLEIARTVAASGSEVPTWVLSGAGDRFLSTLKTYGVEWLKDGGHESNFDAPEALEILTWWKELSDLGQLVIAPEGAGDIFRSGGSVFYMDSSASVTDHAIITDFAWGGALPPQGPKATTPTTDTYGFVNAVPKTTEEKQLAGWLWIKWLASIEALAQWIPVTSYFPARISVVDSPELTAFYEQYPVARQLFNEVAPAASILAASPALSEVRANIATDVINELLLGRLTPEDAQLKLKAEADTAISIALGE